METGAHTLHTWEGEVPMALPSLYVPNVNHTLKNCFVSSFNKVGSFLFSQPRKSVSNFNNTVAFSHDSIALPPKYETNGCVVDIIGFFYLLFPLTMKLF